MRLVYVFLLSLLLVGCGQPEPYRLGFIGPLTGRNADLGIDGRNGAQLAIEQINAAGGINGRPIEFIVRSDEQSPEKGSQVLQELIDLNVDAIIGPMTSVITVALMPQADEAKMTMLAITATSDLITGKDDFTIRILSSTADHAAKHAANHFANLGYRRPHVIYDLGNEAYTRSWFGDYRRGFTSVGGEAPMSSTFVSSESVDFDAIAREVLQTEPDLIVLCTNSVDAAAFARAIRLQSPDVQLAASEWAGTERLISLGGKYVEGMLVPQYLSRDDTSEKFVSFVTSYQSRFNDQPPGFAGKVAYDGTYVLAEALRQRKNDEPLRDTVLRIGHFEGLQGDINIDLFGDTSSETFLTRITEGRFRVQERL